MRKQKQNQIKQGSFSLCADVSKLQVARNYTYINNHHQCISWIHVLMFAFDSVCWTHMRRRHDRLSIRHKWMHLNRGSRALRVKARLKSRHKWAKRGTTSHYKARSHNLRALLKQERRFADLQQPKIYKGLGCPCHMDGRLRKQRSITSK